jgi:hypothetical protein
MMSHLAVRLAVERAERSESRRETHLRSCQLPIALQSNPLTNRQLCSCLSLSRTTELTDYWLQLLLSVPVNNNIALSITQAQVRHFSTQLIRRRSLILVCFVVNDVFCIRVYSRRSMSPCRIRHRSPGCCNGVSETRF